MRLASPSYHDPQTLEQDPLEDLQPGVEPTPAPEEDIYSATTVRIDRTDEGGRLIGYSLITETEWDKIVESYDLNDNLISSSYTSEDGYTHHSTWEIVLDSSGAAIGNRHTSVSSIGSSSDSWVEIYDTEDNLLSSTYNSSDGSWEITTRVAPPDLSIGPAPLSHALQTSGAWADGPTYQRSELFDINGNLVRSESLYSDGSTELYTIEPVFNEDGIIQGYEGTWTYTDPDGEISSSSESFDADLNPTWEINPIYCKDFPGEAGLNLTTVLEPGFEPRIAFADQGMFDVQSTRSNASATQPFITSNQTDLKLNSHSHQDTTHGMLLGGLDLALRGNKLDNVLVGNTGNNQIAGGRGKDLVTGGSGRDHFIFRNHRHSFDTITDFNAEEDKFLLKGELFSDLFKASGLRKEVIGSVLRLDAETGHLLFSPVGEGSGSRPIKLALVQGLEAADFSADLFLFG